MQALAAIVGLVVIGYGFSTGGIPGALTGLVAAVGVGSGFAIALAESGTGVAATGFMRSAQRSGGVLAALGCLTGAYFGGWRLGWLWGIGGYTAGVASALVLSAIYRLVGKPQPKVAQKPLPRSALPSTFDLNDREHVAVIEDIRQKYAAVLTDESHPYGRCMYRPSSLLPYPKPAIRAALNALLDFVEERRDSVLLDENMRTPELADTLGAALVHLDDFLEVTPEQLPTDPLENASVGIQLQQGT